MPAAAVSPFLTGLLAGELALAVLLLPVLAVPFRRITRWTTVPSGLVYMPKTVPSGDDGEVLLDVMMMMIEIPRHCPYKLAFSQSLLSKGSSSSSNQCSSVDSPQQMPRISVYLNSQLVEYHIYTNYIHMHAWNSLCKCGQSPVCLWRLGAAFRMKEFVEHKNEAKVH